MKTGMNMFGKRLFVKFKPEKSDDCKTVKNYATDSDANVPIIHPDAANATVGTLLCAAVSTLSVVAYLFFSK